MRGDTGRRGRGRGRGIGRGLLLATVLAVALSGGGPPGAPAIAAGPHDRQLPEWVDVPETVYFPETGHHLAEPLLFHWRTNGGRTVFGLPISEPVERDGLTVQYFERAVLEYRPDTGGATELVVGLGAVTNTEVNLRTGPGTEWGKVGELRRDAAVRLVDGPVLDGAGEPWYRIAGRFGTGWSKGEYFERRADPIAVATVAVAPDDPRLLEPAFRPLAPIVLGALGPDSAELLVFPTTGHTLTGAFKRFWAAHGGALTLGLPLSEPFREVSPDDGRVYLVQYLERAKLEYHPEAAGSDAEVQLAALGRRQARAGGVPTAPVARAAGAPDYDEADFRTPKWIEVDLSEQRMIAWEGDTPYVNTLIHSGKRGWETPPSVYRTFRKVPRDDMTLGEPSDPEYYYSPNVSWVMYFLEGGYAIHGAVWDDAWGTPTSHGCINTPAGIAADLYEWAPLRTLVWIHH